MKESTKEKIIFYVGLAFSLSFLMRSIILNMSTRRVHPLSLWISLIPFIHYLIRCYRIKKGKEYKLAYVWWYICYFMGYYMCVFGIIAWTDAACIMTNPASYQRCMNQYKAEDEKIFFPKQLTSDMKNISFIDMVGVLQADGLTVLGYETTAEEVARYKEKYKDKALVCLNYEETLCGGEHDEYLVCNTARLLVKGDPSDYEVLVMSYNEDSMNFQPYMSGILLSEKQKQLIFFIVCP